MRKATDVQQTRRAFAHLAQSAAEGNQREFRERLHSCVPAIRDYLLSFELADAPAAFTARYVGDAFQRFVHTLDFVPLPAGPRILELGANPYFFHVLLRQLFPEAQLKAANFFDHDIFSDRLGSTTHYLRSSRFGEDWAFSSSLFNLEVVPRYPYPAGSFDLVFWCETLEHLVVNPLPVFRKIRRLLSPGGHLIITLPNAARLTNFACVLDGHNPFDIYHPDTGVHGRHNREFTLAEMTTLLTLYGFTVRRAETRYRFDYEHVPIEAVDYTGLSVLDRRASDLYRILRSAGGQLEHRGDNLYLLAQKPQATAGAAESLPEPPVIGYSTSALHLAPRVEAFLDRIEDDANRLAVTGWAFLTDDEGNDGDWIKIVLSSATICHTVFCPRNVRQDVSDRYGLERNDPGFSITIAKAELEPGLYQVGLLLGGNGLATGYRDLELQIIVA